MSNAQFLTLQYRSKFQTRRYQTIEELAYDVNLIFDNCELYNESNSTIGKEAMRLRKLLKKTKDKLLSQ
jgi:hypothetical protein